MTQLSKLLVGALAALLVTGALVRPARADANVCDGVQCSEVTIERLYVRSSGTIYVATSGTETGLDNCTPASGTYLGLNMADGNADLIYKTLLAASIAGRAVTIRTKDTPGASCQVSYVLLDD